MTTRDTLIAFAVVVLVAAFVVYVFINHADRLKGPEPVAAHLKIRRLPAAAGCEYVVDRTNEICWLVCDDGVQLISKFEGCGVLLSRTDKE